MNDQEQKELDLQDEASQQAIEDAKREEVTPREPNFDDEIQEEDEDEEELVEDDEDDEDDEDTDEDDEEEEE